MTAGAFVCPEAWASGGGMRVEYREEPCSVALNRVKGMPFEWSLNPYMGCVHRCTFCYVRAFERRADRPSDERYGRSIRVKTNVVEVLRRELASKRHTPEVAIGAATDPYQPAEGMYRLTRGCIEALGHARAPFGIITRGPMVVRDIDVLQSAARRADVSVSVSIPTLDEAAWRTTEPGTAPPRKRLRAVRMLADAGIEVNVALAPVLPGLTDAPRQLAEVVKAARDAGASGTWCRLLHLRPGTREHFMEDLARDWPELVPRYQQLYGAAAYQGKRQEAELKELVSSLAGRYPQREPEAGVIRPAVAEQLALFG
ncbi:MAG: radical SAM protein [Dehalococcoidia bacterium]|nr:radical SAM protein [Dehalococcoidia bacterium]